VYPSFDSSNAWFALTVADYVRAQTVRPLAAVERDFGLFDVATVEVASIIG
jgi:hypothetical protein